MASSSKRAPAQVELTNQQKVFYPKSGFTKGDMLAYYRDVAPYLLPHLKGRPVTLIRYPDGVQGIHFYEKNAPRFTPGWVTTHKVSRRHSEGAINYIVIDQLQTLLWCANLGAIELHPFLHRVPAISRPTSIVFDLDPGEGANLLACVEVAFLVRALLTELGLESLPKVSGSKGLQIYVPLNTPATYENTGAFAKAIARLLESRHPDLVVSQMAKTARRKRVMIDWSQNNPSKTTVAVYSLRAKRDEPYVSMPVEWKELRAASRTGKLGPLQFPPDAALARLERRGDLFADVLKLKQKLPARFRTTTSTAPARTQTPEASSRALAAYRKKRDFAKTAEPAPRAKPGGKRTTKATGTRGKRGSPPQFVIQKHAARNLHYDFRLEFDGVLKSWAVPKGLPYETGVKRAGFQTEDHPFEYLKFEGTIPKGQYGGGTVMVWDIGTFEVIEGDPASGRLLVELKGKKLRGRWRLFRIRNEDGKPVWLIQRSGESMRPISARRDDASVLTRRSMARIARDNDAQWNSGPHA